MEWNDYKEYQNKVHLENLGFILLMPIVIDLFSVIVQQMGMSGSSIVTMAIYGVTLIVILFRLIKITPSRQIINDLLLLALLYIPFAVNYLFFTDTRHYLISQDMLIIYVFFLPVSVFSVLKISNWDNFFVSLIRPGIMALVIAAFILLFLNYERYLIYMGFSYALLPFICNFYRMARNQGREEDTKYRFLYIIFFFIGMLIILAFGARAAITFAALYVIVYELLRADIKPQHKMTTWIALFIIVAVVWLNMDNIAKLLMQFSFFRDSYFLNNLLSGRLLESGTRELLYEACRNRISTMGLSVSGFFGDRAFCLGYAYPHNIIYEILMSFGWIFGIVSIIFYAFELLRAFLHNKEVTIFILLTLLTRYFISGSYLTEGRFWITTALIIALSYKRETLK